MIESNFVYTQLLLNKINTSIANKYNVFIEIAMFIIFVGAIILLVTGNTVLGLVFILILAMLGFSLFIIKRDIIKSNQMLDGQRINIVFNETNMLMTCKLNEKTLYTTVFKYDAIKKIVDKKDTLFIYFDKGSAVIIPKLSFKTSDDCQIATQLMGNNYIL